MEVEKSLDTLKEISLLKDLSTLPYTWPNQECQIFGTLQLAKFVQAKAELLHS